MNDGTHDLDIIRIDGGRAAKARDVVSRESRISIRLNDFEVVALMCSPVSLKYLAVGFLFSEGFVNRKKDVHAVDVDEKEEVVRVTADAGEPPPHDSAEGRLIAASGGRGLTGADFAERAKALKSGSQLKIHPDTVISLMKEFLGRSKGFDRTGAIHSAALCGSNRIEVFHEDIGRHNAIDKAIGQAVLEEMSMEDKILVTSGRISAEILVKAARCGTPIVMSKSAPTDLAVKIASEANITIVGFAREQRMNVYSNAWRIQHEGR
ncbi:MAG: formate dehydrogenase accessory sulfurtransferase FdhD [Methanobacteriota archaeon]|nr:MAG: formate dehydrogenase accessory sulfurtransferase FdhD [Euryarchaeota archaeon]